MSDDIDIKRCTKMAFISHLQDTISTFREVQEQWEQVKAGQHFFVTNAYYDYFHYEVKNVDAYSRVLEVIDHSRDDKVITWREPYIGIYDFYDTYEELRENTDFKQSFF